MHLIERNWVLQIVSTLDDIVQRQDEEDSRYYNQNPRRAGLNAVAITLPLEGNYSNVVGFIRELESSDTFFLISSIDLEGSTQATAQPVNTFNSGAGTSPSVSLSLALETYFYQ
jgi:hypothetical protein